MAIATPEKTPAIHAALLHVKLYHSQVSMVVFYPDQRWAYSNDAGEQPAFGTEINVDLLDLALDEAYEAEGLPCAFALPHSEE